MLENNYHRNTIMDFMEELLYQSTGEEQPDYTNLEDVPKPENDVQFSVRKYRDTFFKKILFNGKQLQTISKKDCHTYHKKLIESTKIVKDLTKEDCPICFEELNNNNFFMFKCNHGGCIDCVSKALKQSDKCFICRAQIN
jgi:hypothetical protein